MVLDKWRARRKSFRELRRREAELYAEYLKMRQQEIDLKASLAAVDGLGYNVGSQTATATATAPGITVLQDRAQTASF